MKSPQVALITGAARRIGAAIARELHGAGMNVVIHYRASAGEALALAAELEAQRPGSAHTIRADLLDRSALTELARHAHARWGRLDALVNNASSYYKTPMGKITEAAFDDLIGSNFKAPLFLTQACAALMHEGAVVNIIDVHAHKPVLEYAVYCAAKAGLWALTESLALELAPRIRVNGVAPGHMIWATDNSMSVKQKQAALAAVPLQRLGGGEEVARTVRFLLSPDAAYIAGAVLPVDGGLRLS